MVVARRLCYNCGQNGQPEPNLTNLNYKKSNSDGSWPSVPAGGQGPGDGHVFAADATINQNDWTLVPVNTGSIMVFRKNAAGSGLDATVYNVSNNTWSAVSVPAFGSGKSFKSGAGLFGATDGTTIWLFCINTDAANSILYSIYDGTSWTSWATVPGTESGTHTRNYIAGYPIVGNGQIGLIWTEGAGSYNVVTTSLGTDTVTLSIISPAPNQVISGPTVQVTYDVVGDATEVDHVVFQLDSGTEVTTTVGGSSYQFSGVSDGPHTLIGFLADSDGDIVAGTTKFLFLFP